LHGYVPPLVGTNKTPLSKCFKILRNMIYSNYTTKYEEIKTA
jgi:hypothetical protein